MGPVGQRHQHRASGLDPEALQALAQGGESLKRLASAARFHRQYPLEERLDTLGVDNHVHGLTCSVCSCSKVQRTRCCVPSVSWVLTNT